MALRVATLPLRNSTLSLSNLGLDPQKPYLAFDFWAEEYLGTVSDSMEVPSLELGSCQVIAFRELQDHPQFLACTRHVSMGAISVKKQIWAEGTLTLELTGIPQTMETYWLHCPDAWKLVDVSGEGADVSVRSSNRELLELLVHFHTPRVIVRTEWER